MKTKCLAVLDTNVLVSAMYSELSPLGEILKLVEAENIIPIFDKRILKEYCDVLQYNKFKYVFTDEIKKDTFYTVVSAGICVDDVHKTTQAIKDSKDIPFFEVKEAIEELPSSLITGNIKDFPKKDPFILTPREALCVLACFEVFISAKENYDKDFQKVVDSIIKTDKYTSGQELLDDIF